MADLDLEVESWVWYSLTWLVVIVRMYAFLRPAALTITVDA